MRLVGTDSQLLPQEISFFFNKMTQLPRFKEEMDEKCLQPRKTKKPELAFL